MALAHVPAHCISCLSLARLSPPPVIIQARSASVYTIGVWTLSVGDGELKLWTANGFLWVLRSASNGWVDVKNGSEEITEWSAGGMGTRAVAPATALGGLTESVAGRPRQPCLQSFGDSFTFGDQGTWNLTRRDGNYVEITCKHSPAHNLYRFSTERPGFKHMNWGGCVSTVTLQASHTHDSPPLCPWLHILFIEAVERKLHTQDHLLVIETD